VVGVISCVLGRICAGCFFSEKTNMTELVGSNEDVLLALMGI
jgi:hypothetical protein